MVREEFAPMSPQGQHSHCSRVPGNSTPRTCSDTRNFGVHNVYIWFHTASPVTPSRCFFFFLKSCRHRWQPERGWETPPSAPISQFIRSYRTGWSRRVSFRAGPFRFRVCMCPFGTSPWNFDANKQGAVTASPRRPRPSPGTPRRSSWG